MQILLDGEIAVHYGFAFLGDGDEEQPELASARQGQLNGLAGAMVPGWLSFVTGLHTGRVPFSIVWHDTEPPGPDPSWEDVVEVSFTPSRRDLTLLTFEDGYVVEVPELGSLRARYSAGGMDAGRHLDLRIDEPPADRYLLELWPARPAADSILRSSSEIAAYWHRVARGTD